MSLIVSKFGGSSLADAAQARKVIDIIKSNPSRQVIVVSAPGKRHRDDAKITDLLLQWHARKCSRSELEQLFRTIAQRFAEIERGLEVQHIRGDDFIAALSSAVDNSSDYAASRGEYLMGKIIAKALAPLGYEFLDAADCIRIGPNGYYDEQATHELVRSKVGNRRVVIPGFYGTTDGNTIRTFSRGGSDISGAIVAAALRADVNENWTDVSGIRAADPELVKNPRCIQRLTYDELRELAYTGAKVFHSLAMFPVKKAGVPTRILNTNAPHERGTEVLAHDEAATVNAGTITGIAARTGFSLFIIKRMMINEEVGSLRRMLEPFEHHEVSVEHVPSGIDSITVIADQRQLDGKEGALCTRLTGSFCGAESVVVEHDVALVTTVGRGMRYRVGIATRLLGAVSRAGVSKRAIDQGGSEDNITIAVRDEDCKRTVNAIYDEFFRKR